MEKLKYQIENSIKCLDTYAKALKELEQNKIKLDYLDTITLHISYLKAWAGIDVETSENSLHKHIVMPRFEFTYTFTDRTDASIHTEIIEAETAEEGLNALHRKHNYRIEWRTTKELNGA